MNKEKKYSGVIIPAVTPLTASHSLDHVAVEKMFDHFHNSNVYPFILGTTGEASSLSLSIKNEFLQLAGRLKKKSDVLYAGISSNAFVESVELAKRSFDHGVDVVVATIPSYYSLTETAMLQYFEQLAEAVNGPLMIYNIPATTHMSVPLDVIDRLSFHPNVVGTKDSERNESRLSMSLELWKNRSDFSHLLGWAAKSAEALLSGSDGLVPSTGNIQAQLYADLYLAARQDDQLKAYSLQKISDELGNIYQSGRTLGESIWALKVLMQQLGLCGSHVMPPIYEGSDETEEKLKSAFDKILKTVR